jgi:signal peptidase I
VTLDLRDAEWATFTDTNSMDPIIDQGANAIEIVPDNPSQLKEGDIISYKSKYAEGTIIHRIVEINNDNEWYARVKGDNLDFQDPGKVRFDQIQRVVVGILY